MKALARFTECQETASQTTQSNVDDHIGKAPPTSFPDMVAPRRLKKKTVSGIRSQIQAV